MRLIAPYEAQGHPPEELWIDPDKLREDYPKSLDYSLDVVTGFAERYLDDGSLLIVLGDHEPLPWVTGKEVTREVPVHVITRDREIDRAVPGLGLPDRECVPRSPSTDASAWTSFDRGSCLRSAIPPHRTPRDYRCPPPDDRAPPRHPHAPVPLARGIARFSVQIPAGLMIIEPAAPCLSRARSMCVYGIHKGLGAVLLVVILLRVLWRLTHRPPPMPGHWPPLERRIASVTHGLIYVLLVVVPVSGYVRVIGDGFPIELLDWLGVPPLLPNMPAVASVASLVHRFAVFLLLGLVAVHIAEVLRHQLVEQDGEMARMWPPVGGGSGEEA